MYPDPLCGGGSGYISFFGLPLFKYSLELSVSRNLLHNRRSYLGQQVNFGLVEFKVNNRICCCLYLFVIFFKTFFLPKTISKILGCQRIGSFSCHIPICLGCLLI